MTIRTMSVATLTIVALALAGCQPTPVTTSTAAASLSETDAAKIADATEAVWTSMDAAKIKAIYAPGIVGFDLAVPPLSSDRATWDKAQDGYAAAKLDKADRKQRQIQILDADTLVMSGVWALSSSATPANNATIRCTDVFEKAPGGSWPIANEHCSQSPEA